MLVLGINGSPDLLHDNHFRFSRASAHDASAVLVEDGRVVYAAEEERLNRVKHTNAFPERAIRAALAARGARLADVDAVAWFATRGMLDRWMKSVYLSDPARTELYDAESVLARAFRMATGEELDPARLRWVHHHEAHATSAMAMSGYERALVTTFDAQGDASAGMVFRAAGTALERLHNLTVPESLGFFYLDVITYLGYWLFDEYKVMGLAPYGDPSVHRELFRTFYTLLPDGKYQLHKERIPRLYELGPPRRKGAPFTRLHQDLAAALQEALEEIAFHVLRHYRHETGERDLCLAGGVAHNCTLNGKIVASGLFDRVFVQPAAHDAGCALGAALHVYHAESGDAAPRVLEHVYWGTDAGCGDAVKRVLDGWGGVLRVERLGDVAERAAALLAEGKVLGWVQGRAEFGPRALGNRSILADPRPAANRDRVNLMVKKREGYRPFAPSVLQEHAADWFELPEAETRYDFMVCIVGVRPGKREQLGAITHVDGTARIQTVSAAANPPYWALIDAFRRHTGVPMLLNTSFNNDVEPIVDSVADAVACFLTTGIDHLVAGEYLATRRDDVGWEAWLPFRPSLPVHMALHEVRTPGPDGGRLAATYALRKVNDDRFEHALSPAAYRALSGADGTAALGELIGDADGAALVDEVLELWSRRLIVLSPPAAAN